MDRIDFTKSINFSNFEVDVNAFFDQIMALYNIVGNSGMDIITESDQKSSIRFILLPNNNKEAEILYNAIGSRNIYIYGHSFRSELSKVDDRLIIFLSENASG